MTTTKTNALTDSQIATYEAHGFNRWTMRDMDRLYINAKDLGLEVEYYKTGNVKNARWNGVHISNADARRLLSSKVYVDVKTCKLSVTTSFDLSDAMSLEEAAKRAVAEVEAELFAPATETATSEHSEVEDRREELVKTVEDFIAGRIALSEGMEIPENKRKRGVAMLERAREKTIDAIRNLPDEYVMYQKLDGNSLVQTYAFR